MDYNIRTMVKVANQRKTKFGEHVGRPCILGNPFVTGIDGTRDEVITKYKIWLDEQIVAKNDVYEELVRFLNLAREGDLTLLCWCAPKSCHADHIKNWIDSQLSNEQVETKEV
jgi:hypothetical protein